jgi:hypothetical protein
VILKPHPIYGLPHAIATDYDDGSAFERCMSSTTVAIGQLERLDMVRLDADQRSRLINAAKRLQACIWGMDQ